VIQEEAASEADYTDHLQKAFDGLFAAHLISADLNARASAACSFGDSIDLQIEAVTLLLKKVSSTVVAHCGLTALKVGLPCW